MKAEIDWSNSPAAPAIKRNYVVNRLGREAMLNKRRMEAAVMQNVLTDTLIGSGSPIKVQRGYDSLVLHDLYKDDRLVLNTPLEIMEENVKMSLDIPTIRLSIERSGSINTITWPEESGMFKSIDDTYASVDTLPEWMQRKLAVLMLLNPDEPEKKEISGIGRRISENVYWVYLDGSDTREESKDQST